MTDDEIVKRMAEIEGWYVERVRGFTRIWEDEDACSRGDVDCIVSPLSWQDLGPLVEKYQVCLWYARDYGTWNAEVNGIGAEDESLPRAVCLAIIASKEEGDRRVASNKEECPPHRYEPTGDESGADICSKCGDVLY